MASKKEKCKSRLLAQIVTGDRKACAFCKRQIDDEVTYGKLYSIGDIQCHYFCALLSCCLIQKGKDTEGLFGFLYPDILAEVERSKKHKCSYCGTEGASLGCSVSQCRKQFHLPCGRERNAVSLFYGNYKSFCELHAPKQKIEETIMSKAKQRKSIVRKNKNNILIAEPQEVTEEKESVCVICYESVEGFPTTRTFWPPCCARDAWFHRHCLQRMALSAGVHYLKCPLCNDKDDFYNAVLSQGYYVPDRDAAWELEQNAFAEIYERPLECKAVACKCPMGRNHDADAGMWDIKLCMLCGSTGVHAHCFELTKADAVRFICDICKPIAPTDLDLLARTIDSVILSEQQTAVNSRRGPIMPSRMSLRRTKQRMQYSAASTSRTNYLTRETIQVSESTQSSRQELNLRTPKRISKDNAEQTRDKELTINNIENSLLSPIKLLEEGLTQKMDKMKVKDFAVDKNRVVEELRKKFNKPKPLSEKKKIVNDMLEELFNNILQEAKVKEPIKEWCSPRKCSEIKEEVDHEMQEHTDIHTEKVTLKFIDKDEEETMVIDNIENINKDNLKIIDNYNEESNSSFELPAEFIADTLSDDSLPKSSTIEIKNDSHLEISENNQTININIETVENNDFVNLLNVNQQSTFKFSKIDVDTTIDVESFKDQYLKEINFKCNFDHNHAVIDKKDTKLKTAIDFALEACEGINRKRKLNTQNGGKKRRKMADKSKRLKSVKLRIKLKDKVKKKVRKPIILKQSLNNDNKQAVTPIKHKKCKQQKTPDNLKQTSIYSFFKSV